LAELVHEQKMAWLLSSYGIRVVMRSAGLSPFLVPVAMRAFHTYSPCLEEGLMPHEVKELAGHADINTTMNYYVGIRESLIDRARGASSAALEEDSSALSVRATQNGENGEKQTALKTSQPLTMIGVTETCSNNT
jgi:hypothetical protein